MSNKNQNKVILALSIPLTVLLILVSCVGLFVPGTYSTETVNWAAQAIAQDIADLFLVTPLLIIATFFAYRKSKVGILMWGGTLFYIIYTFIIYCFDVHFNSLFLFYCLTLGLSFYSFVYFLLMYFKEPVADWFNDKVPVKTVGIYIIILAALFYLLWLSEVIPAMINGKAPESIAEIGLFTNPVHAIDLSVCLPALIISGIFLLKRKTLGFLLAPVFLIFMILMDITIVVMIIVENIRGLGEDYTFMVVMSILAVISVVMLFKFLRSIKPAH